MNDVNKDDIAVIYIARYADGINLFQNFIESYKRHPAGISHNLYIALKGCPEEKLEDVKSVFSGVEYILKELPDIGYCKGTVLLVSQSITETYICPISTTNEIQADDWLLKLYENLKKEGVGIVGSSANYQSISTMRHFCKNLKILYYFNPWKRKKIKRYYNQFLKLKNWPWTNYIIHPIKSLYRLRRIQKEQKKEDTSFPPFPNPHIRTTAYLMERKHFLKFISYFPLNKDDVMYFESGYISLTARYRQLGLKALVIDKNGKAYDIEDWAKSGTFRVFDQGNCLVSDKRMTLFDNASDNEKIGWIKVSWGDYADVDYPKDMLNTKITFTEKLTAVAGELG